LDNAARPEEVDFDNNSSDASALDINPWAFVMVSVADIFVWVLISGSRSPEVRDSFPEPPGNKSPHPCLSVHK
jgi:hypothetical protein